MVVSSSSSSSSFEKIKNKQAQKDKDQHQDSLFFAREKDTIKKLVRQPSSVKDETESKSLAVPEKEDSPVAHKFEQQAPSQIQGFSPADDRHFSDMIEDRANISNYDQKFTKNTKQNILFNIKQDILDSQMVYRPKNIHMSEENSVEFGREQIQIYEEDIRKNLYNGQLIATRKAPKHQLKRGQSHEDNYVPDLVLESCEDAKIPKAKKQRPGRPSSVQRSFKQTQNNKNIKTQMFKYFDNKKAVGFSEHQNAPNDVPIGMPPLTPTIGQAPRESITNKQHRYANIPKLDIRQHQNDLIIKYLNQQVSVLISNGQQIMHYHDENSQSDQDKDDSNSSIGTISSIDELEMGLMFNGDHIYQFQAIQTVKNIVKLRKANQEKLLLQLKVLESRWQKVKNFIFCRDRTKYNNQIEAMRKQLCENDNPAHLFEQLGITGNFVKNSEKKWRQVKIRNSKTVEKFSFDDWKLTNQAKMKKLISNQKLPIDDLNKLKSQQTQKMTPTSQNTPTAAQQQKSQEKQQAEKKEQTKADNPNKEVKSLQKLKISLWDRAKQNKDGKNEQNQNKLYGRERQFNPKSPKNQNKVQNFSGDQQELIDNDKYEFGRNDQFSYRQNASNIENDSDDQGEDADQKDDDHHIECELSPYIGNQKDKTCREKFSERYMIDPSNSRLKKFHILVSFSYYIDFILTSFLVGNYYYQEGHNPEFMNHSKWFMYIITIQIIDILLNFLKIQISDIARINDPMIIGKNYIFGEFIFDVVAVLPWSNIQPKWVFIRYLKFRNINTYQQYVDDLIQDLTQNFLNNQQLKKLKSVLRLILKIIFITHFFANLWVYTGLRELEQGDQGWIVNNIQKELIPKNKQKDFLYLYIMSIYWTITSFSSVGYGDITGTTKSEYIFQMIVEMIGIGFFGYMIGTFQQLLKGFRVKDLKAEYQDEIDLWLIQLDKARKSVILSKQIFKEVRNFYSYHFRYDAVLVRHTTFFDQLKPRLKKAVLDTVFGHFYQIFHTVFEGCGIDFQREIFNNSKFTYFGQRANQEDGECDWLKDLDLPIIEHSSKVSKKIHFILSGKVHIMNSDAMYEYGVLQEGNYFGDISILLDQPSNYSYCYNPHNEKALMMMSMTAQNFLELCDRYQLAKHILTERAQKRSEMFENYKSIMLIKYMKVIVKNPNIFAVPPSQNKSPNFVKHEQPGKIQNHGNISGNQMQPKFQRDLKIHFQLLDALVEHYRLNRQLSEYQKRIKGGIFNKYGKTLKLSKNVSTDLEYKVARQKAIIIDKIIKEKRAILKKQQQSPGILKDTDQSQDNTHVYKNASEESPQYPRENVTNTANKQPNKEKNIINIIQINTEDGAIGNQVPNQNPQNNQNENIVEDSQGDILQSLQHSMQDRVLEPLNQKNLTKNNSIERVFQQSTRQSDVEPRNKQQTDTPRYESLHSEPHEDARAIQSKNQMNIQIRPQDLNAEGGELSQRSTPWQTPCKNYKSARIEFRSKSADEIEGGSVESSLSISPIQRFDEAPNPRPSIELKQLSTIRQSKSSSSKSRSTHKSNKNLKPPLNPKSGQANQSSSGSGSGIQRSGGSKTSSIKSKQSKTNQMGDQIDMSSPVDFIDPTIVTKHQTVEVHNEQNTKKLGSNPVKLNDSTEQIQNADFKNSNAVKIVDQAKGTNQTTGNQSPATFQDVNSQDKKPVSLQVDSLGKKKEAQRNNQPNSENISQSFGIQAQAQKLSHAQQQQIPQQSNQVNNSAEANIQDNESLKKQSNGCKVDRKGTCAAESFSKNQQFKDDRIAHYILKDIMERDNQNVTFIQLTDKIEKNRQQIKLLLKKYFQQILLEGQKKRDLKQIFLQSLRRVSFRQTKRNNMKMFESETIDSTRHLDNIIWEYLNIHHQLMGKPADAAASLDVLNGSRNLKSNIEKLDAGALDDSTKPKPGKKTTTSSVPVSTNSQSNHLTQNKTQTPFQSRLDSKKPVSTTDLYQESQIGQAASRGPPTANYSKFQQWQQPRSSAPETATPNDSKLHDDAGAGGTDVPNTPGAGFGLTTATQRMNNLDNSPLATFSAANLPNPCTPDEQQANGSIVSQNLEGNNKSQTQKVAEQNKQPSESYQNMQTLQNKEFQKVKQNLVGNILDQIKAFTDRFESKIASTEQRINKAIITRLHEIDDRFDQLDQKDKDYFVQKLDQKYNRDQIKFNNLNRVIIKPTSKDSV